MPMGMAYYIRITDLIGQNYYIHMNMLGITFWWSSTYFYHYINLVIQYIIFCYTV